MFRVRVPGEVMPARITITPLITTLLGLVLNECAEKAAVFLVTELSEAFFAVMKVTMEEGAQAGC